MGANKTEGAIVRVGKALGTVMPVLDQSDSENHVPTVSGLHNRVNALKDHNIICNELSTRKIFQHTPDRKHTIFPNPRNVLHGKDRSEFKKWMEVKMAKFYGKK